MKFRLSFLSWRNLTKMTKLSIIIPYRNVEQYISKCLSTVLYQTLDDIEVICINDASEDASENIVKEWTTSEISELFKRKTDEDCTLITCASVYDFAYDRVGVILYTNSKEGYIHVAFMDKEGNMQHCGVEATIIDSPEFTYLGNGEVTFKVSSKVDV